jgi:hypothetical protein
MDDVASPQETKLVTQNGIRRRRAVLLVAGTSLLILLLLIVLLDPLAWLTDIFSVARTRAELPRAMERWEAQGISGYQINVKGFVPLACIIDGELTVQDGHLVQVRMRENPLIPEAPLHPVDPDKWDMPGCSCHDLTVAAMFERANKLLQEIRPFGAPVVIKFDEALGYITEYRFGRSSRGGFLGYRSSECCTRFEFSDLTVVSP